MRGAVLIVHDDPAVRRFLGEFLASKSYRVLSAATGQEALAVLEEDVPSLLVVGVGMPLMSGWKLIEALAHYPDLSRIPRLLVNPTDAPAATCARALALLEGAAADTPPTGDAERVAAAGPRRSANA